MGKKKSSIREMAKSKSLPKSDDNASMNSSMKNIVANNIFIIATVFEPLLRLILQKVVFLFVQYILGDLVTCSNLGNWMVSG